MARSPFPLTPEEQLARARDSASLFAAGSEVERQREADRLAEGRGMTLQQGLALAPRTTTTGVSAGGVPIPTEGPNVPGAQFMSPSGQQSMFNTSSLIPIFQTNWMKDIPKNRWNADGTFSLPSANELLEQLKQPEWSKTEIPGTAATGESVRFQKYSTKGVKGTSGTSELYVPIDASGKTLVNLPSQFRAVNDIITDAVKAKGFNESAKERSAQKVLSSGKFKQIGDLGKPRWYTNFLDDVMPFYNQGNMNVGTPSKTIMTPPSPTQSSPSGFFGLTPTQTIKI